jgi:hypothetical protein
MPEWKKDLKKEEKKKKIKLEKLKKKEELEKFKEAEIKINKRKNKKKSFLDSLR